MATRLLYRRDEAKLVVPADSAMVTMMSCSSGDSDTQRHALNVTHKSLAREVVQ